MMSSRLLPVPGGTVRCTRAVSSLQWLITMKARMSLPQYAILSYLLVLYLPQYAILSYLSFCPCLSMPYFHISRFCPCLRMPYFNISQFCLCLSMPYFHASHFVLASVCHTFISLGFSFH